MIALTIVLGVLVLIVVPLLITGGIVLGLGWIATRFGRPGEYVLALAREHLRLTDHSRAATELGHSRGGHVIGQIRGRA